MLEFAAGTPICHLNSFWLPGQVSTLPMRKRQRGHLSFRPKPAVKSPEVDRQVVHPKRIYCFSMLGECSFLKLWDTTVFPPLGLSHWPAK